MLSEAKIAKKKNEKKIGSFKLGKQNFLKLAIKMKNTKGKRLEKEHLVKLS